MGFLSDLHAYGIYLFLHQQGLDTTTPSGRMMFQMLGVSEGPQASATETPCHTLARVAMDDYAATPATRELALELLRVRCLGMTADGSRQLRSGAPVARNSSVNRNPASAPDDLSMFQQDEKAVP
jgi:hypothetical protein